MRTRPTKRSLLTSSIATMCMIGLTGALLAQGAPDGVPPDGLPDGLPGAHPLIDASATLAPGADEACLVEGADGAVRLKENPARNAIHVLARHLPAGAVYDVSIRDGEMSESLGVITIPPGDGRNNGRARAASRCFEATLTVDQEVPAPAGELEGAGGMAHFVLAGRDRGTLRYQVLVEGLSGPPVGAHIHVAPPGEPGPIVIPLDEQTLRGAVELTEEQIDALEAEGGLGSGNFYVNVHTELNMPGEIRGQIFACSDNDGEGPDDPGDGAPDERTGNGLLRVDSARGDALPFGAESVADLVGTTVEVANSEGCVVLSGVIETVMRGGDGDGDGDGGGAGLPLSLGGTPVFEEFLFDVYGPHDASFLRGDTTMDGDLNMTDAVRGLDILFHGAEIPYCLDAADANDDGEIDIGDPLATLWSLFLGGGPLPEPAVLRGFDPTADDLLCEEF